MKLAPLSLQDIINLTGSGLLGKRAYEFHFIYEMLRKHFNDNENDEMIYHELFEFPDNFVLFSIFDDIVYFLLETVYKFTETREEAVETFKIALAILEEPMLQLKEDSVETDSNAQDFDSIKHPDNEPPQQAADSSQKEPSELDRDGISLSRDNAQAKPTRSKRH